MLIRGSCERGRRRLTHSGYASDHIPIRHFFVREYCRRTFAPLHETTLRHLEEWNWAKTPRERRMAHGNEGE